jgi:hypothetical protein
VTRTPFQAARLAAWKGKQTSPTENKFSVASDLGLARMPGTTTDNLGKAKGASSPVSKTLSFETALADHQMPHPDGLFVPQNFVSIDLSQAQCCSMSFETEGGGNDPSRESY